MSDIRQWLEELGLGKYADAFEENDIGVDVLDDVTDQDLREIGSHLGIASVYSRHSGRRRKQPKFRQPLKICRCNQRLSLPRPNAGS